MFLFFFRHILRTKALNCTLKPFSQEMVLRVDRPLKELSCLFCPFLPLHYVSQLFRQSHRNMYSTKHYTCSFCCVYIRTALQNTIKTSGISFLFVYNAPYLVFIPVFVQDFRYFPSIPHQHYGQLAKAGFERSHGLA